MMATIGESMGERGRVRRMNSSSSDIDVVPEGEEGGIWRRGQDHFRHFTSLLEEELEEETSIIQERWSSWSHHRLQASGLALLGLKGRTNGTLYGEDILVFEHPDRQHLGQHRFTHGDIVVLSRSKPIGEKTIEGIVLERGQPAFALWLVNDPKTSGRERGGSTVVQIALLTIACKKRSRCFIPLKVTVERFFVMSFSVRFTIQKKTLQCLQKSPGSSIVLSELKSR